MIADSVRKHIEERHKALCMKCFKDAQRRCRKGERVKSYSLSAEAVESLEMLRLCDKVNITPEEGSKVKAYHLRHCILGVNAND